MDGLEALVGGVDLGGGGVAASQLEAGGGRQRSAKRWTWSRRWAGSVSHQWANMPPLPTAGSWSGSPTQTSRQNFVSAKRMSRARSSVAAIPASSKMTVVPAGRSVDGRAGWLWRRRKLARVVAEQPVSQASTSAALPEGATPTAGRPWARSWAIAERSMVVLPVPAGPTIRTKRCVAATARAAAAWALSQAAVRATPAFRRAHASSAASSSRMAWVVRRRSVTCSDTGRPSSRRAATPRAGGCSSRHRPAAATASSSMSSTSRSALPATSAGRSRCRGPDRPAARLAPCSLTKSIASATTTSRSTAHRPDTPRKVDGSDRASTPSAVARSRHSARSASASPTTCLPGRLARTALRSRRAIVRGSTSALSCSSVQRASSSRSFSAENVPSKARADLSPKRRPSTLPVPGWRPSSSARSCSGLHIACQAHRPAAGTPPASRRIGRVHVVVRRAAAQRVPVALLAGQALVVGD